MTPGLALSVDELRELCGEEAGRERGQCRSAMTRLVRACGDAPASERCSEAISVALESCRALRGEDTAEQCQRALQREREALRAKVRRKSVRGQAIPEPRTATRIAPAAAVLGDSVGGERRRDEPDAFGGVPLEDRARFRRLVERAREGDERAFADIYVARVGGVTRYVASIVRGPDRMEDVDSQTFVLAWRDMPRLREPDRFDAWLFRIAHNQAMDELRRRPLIPLEDVSEPVDESRAVPRLRLRRPERMRKRCVRRWRNYLTCSAMFWSCGSSSTFRTQMSLDSSARANRRHARCNTEHLPECAPCGGVWLSLVDRRPDDRSGASLRVGLGINTEASSRSTRPIRSNRMRTDQCGEHQRSRAGSPAPCQCSRGVLPQQPQLDPRALEDALQRVEVALDGRRVCLELRVRDIGTLEERDSDLAITIGQHADLGCDPEAAIQGHCVVSDAQLVALLELDRDAARPRPRRPSHRHRSDARRARSRAGIQGTARALWR